LKRAKSLNPNVTARPVPIEELVQGAALTVPELAAITNMHPLTIRRAIGARELIAASNGKKGHYRITRADANSWWKGRGGSGLFPELESQAAPTDRKAAADKGFGFLRGKVSGSDEFLERKHAQSDAELEKAQREVEVAS
jgi:excisionase family DNA binding protein